MKEPLVLLDDSRREPGGSICFSCPRAVLRADTTEEAEDALDVIAPALASGHFAAGYVSYEAGYALERRLVPLLARDRAVPLLWLGIFEERQVLQSADVRAFFVERSCGRAYAGRLLHEWSEAEYRARFHRVMALIEAGDIYQANLSFRSQFRFIGDPMALYIALRERAAAGHCAYVDDGERQILSLSPELFFSVADGSRITAKPMKGTAPRGEHPAADAAARDRLRESHKERAENLMIVDLLRNDLSRIANPGTVTAEELFAIETYPTVHQMVSTVTAELKPALQPREIVRALFPCGSVSGAPKIRAMEVIQSLESSQRGVYCGAIGYFAPDGTAAFNVAIRTLTITGDRGELGIGGAVVHDSVPEAEFAECLLKARYFETARKPIELIETLHWSPTAGFVRLQRHLNRMGASAQTLGIHFSRTAAIAALEDAVRTCARAAAHRVRLTLNEQGLFNSAVSVLSEPPRRWRYMVSAQRVSSGDALLRHKTNWRELFAQEHARAVQSGCDEVLFVNEQGQITEGSRSNLFVTVDGRMLTPALSCGLLNGCLRQESIEAGRCSEAILYPQQLAAAEEVHFGNSLRGLIPAQQNDRA